MGEVDEGREEARVRMRQQEGCDTCWNLNQSRSLSCETPWRVARLLHWAVCKSMSVRVSAPG